MTAPAGWYEDPDGSGGQRYYDGRSWTEHRSAPAPKESGPSGGVIAGIVAAVAVVVAIGVAAVWMTVKTDVGEATVTHTPSDAGAETSVVGSGDGAAETGVEAGTLEDQAYGIGMPARDGNFEFVVTGIERGLVVSDPEFPDLQKVAAGEYIFVNMTVTNVGTEPQTFFSSFNTLSDGTTEFTSDDEAWIYLGNTLADLNPGDSIDTAVVFDVPVGTDPQSISLHDGPFSDGVVVGL